MIEKQIKEMMSAGMITEEDVKKFMNKMTGGNYLTAEEKEELQSRCTVVSGYLDIIAGLGIFTDGQIKRARGKVRKAVLEQMKNNEENNEEE